MVRCPLLQELVRWVAAAAALSHWAGKAQDAQEPAPLTGGHDREQTSAIPTALNKTPWLSQRGSWSLSELRKQSATWQCAAAQR